MKYLNVQVLGLSGNHHPSLNNINTKQDVRKLRHYLKFLCGDYLTGERRQKDQGTNPKCNFCQHPFETTDHVLTLCSATTEVKQRLLPELLNTVLQVQPNCIILDLSTHSHWLTQFILDCTSLNLPATLRIGAHNPQVSQVFSVCRDWCHAICKAREKLIC